MEVLRAFFVRAQVAFLMQGRPPSQMTMIIVNMCQQLPLSAVIAVSLLIPSCMCCNCIELLGADAFKFNDATGHLHEMLYDFDTNFWIPKCQTRGQRQYEPSFCKILLCVLTFPETIDSCRCAAE